MTGRSWNGNWHHLNVMIMVSATCSSCSELSDAVPLVADWKTRAARQHLLDVAFGEIGWEVQPKKAWCPDCKKMPR